MTVTVDRLAEYVGADPAGEYVDLLGNCLAEAAALVTGHLGRLAGFTVENGTWTWAPDDPVEGPPVPILDRAHLEVSADLFMRRNAPHGIINEQNGYGYGGDAIRINRDPMAPAYPLLSAWAVPF